MRKIIFSFALMVALGALSASAAWYACGAFQGWDPSAAQELVLGDDGLYRIEIDFSTGTTFKLSTVLPSSSSSQWGQFNSGSINISETATLNKGLTYSAGTQNITAPSSTTLTVVVNQALSMIAFSDGTADIDWGSEAEIYVLKARLSAPDWSNPCVWIWTRGDSDVPLYSSFPGAAMTLVSPGLYEWTEVSTVMPDMILFTNNGSTTERSGDLTFVNNKLWDATGDILGDITDDLGTPASPLGAIESWTDTTYGLTAQCEKGVLEITYYGDGVVKVITRPTGSERLEERRSITVVGEPDGSVSITEDDDFITLTAAQVVTTVDKSSSLISFADAVTGTLYTSETTGIVNRVGSISASFSCPETQSFTGGGYYNRVNLTGSSLSMDNYQTGGWPDNTSVDNHNICIPFVVSNRGFGVLFDDHWRGARVIPANQSLRYSSGSQNPVAYYFVGGGSAERVLENYTSLTGRQELPPYWSLGYISSRYGYATEEEGREVVRRIRTESDIPLDGIVFDIYWQGDRTPYGMGNLEWYTPNFPNPVGMISDFKAMGVNTVLITEPFFAKGSSNYSTLIDKGYSADNDVSGMSWIGGGALLDATNPDALDWMWTFYRKHTANGVAGWWLDLGEPERHDDDSNHQGGSVDQVHNEFGNLWIERVYRGLKEEFPDMRPLLLPRAGTSGMQRFSTFPWTGDIARSWNGLKVQIPAMLCAGMAGVAYLGSDIGGFIASSDIPELYMRWVEFGAFSPVLRTHVNNSGAHAEPYYYTDLLPDLRRFINLRYSYIPYSYTLAYENATKGSPLGRPMSYYTADPSLDDSYQYYWGHDLLIAPVVENATSRSITFPEADGAVWVDLNNVETLYYGGQTVNYDAPLTTLPYFARLGSIIPRYMASSYTSTSGLDRSAITLDCYTLADEGDTAQGYMYDDNVNSTTSLSADAYSLINFAIDCTDGFQLTVSKEGNGYTDEPAVRSLTFNLPLKKIEGKYKLSDGTQLTEAITPEQLAASDAAFYHTDKGTQIHLNWDGTPTTVSVNTGTTGAIALEQQCRLNVSSEDGLIVCRYLLPAGVAESTVDLYDPYGHLIDSVTLPSTQGTVNTATQGTVNTATQGTVNTATLRAIPGVYIVRLTIPGGQPLSTAKIIHQ